MTSIVSPAQIDAYERDGFYIARGLIPREELASLREHYMSLHAKAPIPGVYEPDLNYNGDDPLRVYPRMMHPHRWDDKSQKYLLDRRYYPILRLLMNDEPVAAQSMFYFKPPGAKGQTFHQDNFYLRVRPATCMAAWLAVDAADAGNGGLSVLPGSHKWDLICPESGLVDQQSGAITNVTKEKTTGLLEVVLAAGDCLFFNGSLIHGSGKNTSTTRWRRSLICHYIPLFKSEQVSDFYYPLLGFDGQSVEKELVSHGGSPCGGTDGNAIDTSPLVV